MSGESTVRDALIAETLGDIGKLHDRVNALNVTLEKQTKAFEEQTLKFIDLLQNPSSANAKPSPQGASLEEFKEVIEGFKAHLISAIGKGNERILSTFGSADTAKQSSAQGGTKIEAELEMFKTVTEQWASDAGSIGATMNDAITRLDKSLEQIAVLQERGSARVSNPLSATPQNQISPTAKPDKKQARFPLLAILSTMVITSACLIGAYYATGLAKDAEFGSALAKGWQKFDVPTRKRINDVMNGR